MDDELKGIQEVRLQKNGGLRISMALTISLSMSHHGITSLTLVDFTSGDLWILAEAFKTAAAKRFEIEMGKTAHTEMLYYKGTSEVAEI